MENKIYTKMIYDTANINGKTYQGISMLVLKNNEVVGKYFNSPALGESSIKLQ